MRTQVWFVSNHMLLDSGGAEYEGTSVMINGEKVTITRKDRRDHAVALQSAEASVLCLCMLV